MRTFVAVVFGALVAVAGWTDGAEAQNVEAFLAGTSKDCRGCNLANAKLKRRNLAGADLSGANLAGASFHRSNLRGANFQNAFTYNANFENTDLSGVKNLVQEQIDIACGDDTTVLPQGLKKPQRWDCED